VKVLSARMPAVFDEVLKATDEKRRLRAEQLRVGTQEVPLAG